MKKSNSFDIKKTAVIVAGICAVFFLLGLGFGSKGYAKPDKSWGPHDFRFTINDDRRLEISYEGPNNVFIIESKDEDVKRNDEGWIKIEDKTITFDLKEQKKYYFAKYLNKIYELGSNEDICHVELNIENADEVYLAAGEEYDYKINCTVLGYTEKEIEWKSSDENIATVEDGHVTALGTGEVTVSAQLLDESIEKHVTVSDLFIKAPEEFDVNKQELPCGVYSKEDNDFLDTVLKARINEAGYATRAGVVEAARFLTLNFPYKVDYFYEWGRQGLNKVDGEGRYYLEGLYLHESRFESLIGSNTGPQIWGCPLYSANIHATSPNGLDCSGFVTWAILNAGFDCGDIGAGFTELLDLTDIAELVKNSKDNLDKIKVGDLVHSDLIGAHIGIIVGIDGDIYYVAESTPKEDIKALVITKLDTESFLREWDEIVLMDSFYKEDGNLTDMWY
ncbi:MAG: Ig-like domain-containing protein [Erysipelotrichaceae bacterium]|nr:Ig-like domain-containing protein [Erysipelotrichaceae bacterium]